MGKEQYENYLKDNDNLIYDSVVFSNEFQKQIKCIIILSNYYYI